MGESNSEDVQATSSTPGQMSLQFFHLKKKKEEIMDKTECLFA